MALPLPHAPLPDIANPLEASGWRVSRPDDAGALHTEVLRELCDSEVVLHLGASGKRGVAATLRLVDVVLEQLVLASRADGIAVALALQTRPERPLAEVHSLRVQFALHAASAVREGSARDAPLLIRAHWPREIYRTSRRRAPRTGCAPDRAPHCAPVVRFHHSNQLVSTRDFAVLDISESGGAVRLPARLSPPAPGGCIRRIELELDEQHVVFTDAEVKHVGTEGRGGHRVGVRWQNMPEAGRKLLRRWLARAGEPAVADSLAT